MGCSRNSRVLYVSEVTLPLMYSGAYLGQSRKHPRLGITSKPIDSLPRPCKDLT